MVDEKLIKKIVELKDEQNYLNNIFETAEETGKEVEEIITDRLVEIMKLLDKLEA